jgi:hypothetical protein
MTKTISTLVMVSALTFGGAVAQAADSGKGAAPVRGDVLVQGPSVKAVVMGPVAIHAYSEFLGGALYTARAVTGTDADCQAGAAEGARTGLLADRVVNFTVGAGQVACLATTTSRSFELMWHVQKAAPAAAPTMLARNGR